MMALVSSSPKPRVSAKAPPHTLILRSRRPLVRPYRHGAPGECTPNEYLNRTSQENQPSQMYCIRTFV